MDPVEYKYWAFISYSHADAAWGDWLHKTLETYRVPPRLVGRESRDGSVPKRLFPIFRDREELPGSADLSSNIDTALHQSRYLIVICSPRSAASRWVDEEIKTFKALGREGRVLSLIVDGEPNASDKPGSGLAECFPQSLRYRVDAERNLTKERAEPIAADAREGKDGKANARLKLLAGLLGVAYDELRQREQQRRFRRRLQVAAIALLVVNLLVGSWFWQEHKRADEARQALVSEYTEQGRQLFMAGKPLQAAVYLSEAYRFGGDSVALRFLLARAMHFVDALQSDVTTEGLWIYGAYTRDGSRLVEAHGGDTIDVWDTASGKRLLALKSSNPTEANARFSPDGSLIASGARTSVLAQGATLEIWDSHTGALLRSIDQGRLLAFHFAFAPDSRHIATWEEYQDAARVWDVRSGALLYSLKSPGSRTQDLVFTPDGARVITTQTDTTAIVWDAASGQRLVTLRGHAADIKDLAVSPDGRVIATASADKTARLWDATSGRVLFTLGKHSGEVGVNMFPGHDDTVTSVAFSADGKRVVTGSDDGTAQVWEVATGRILATLNLRGEGKLSTVRFSPDGKWIAAATDANRVWLWSADAYALRGSVIGGSAGFSDDSRRLLTQSQPDKAVQSWDLPSALDIAAVRGHDPALSPDDVHLATLAGNQLLLYATADGTLLRRIDLPSDPNAKAGDDAYGESVSYTPDGHQLFTVSAQGDGYPTLWDATAGAQAMRLHDTGGHIQSAEFIAGSGHLLTRSSGDDAMVIWDVHAGKPLARVTVTRRADAWYALSPDETLLATVERDDVDGFGKTVQTWDVQTGKHLATITPHGSLGDQLAFLPDGKSLLTGDYKGYLSIWDARSGALLHDFASNESGIEGFSLSRDSKTLVAGLQGGSLKAWDFASGTPLWLSREADMKANAARYSSDGTLIFAGAGVWDAATGRPLLRIPSPMFQPALSRGQRYIISESRGTNDAGGFSYSTYLWDIHLEQRDPAVISAEVACRVHLRLAAGQLLPLDPQPQECP